MGKLHLWDMRFVFLHFFVSLFTHFFYPQKLNAKLKLKFILYCLFLSLAPMCASTAVSRSSAMTTTAVQRVSHPAYVVPSGTCRASKDRSAADSSMVCRSHRTSTPAPPAPSPTSLWSSSMELQSPGRPPDPRQRSGSEFTNTARVSGARPVRHHPRIHPHPWTEDRFTVWSQYVWCLFCGLF